VTEALASGISAGHEYGTRVPLREAPST